MQWSYCRPVQTCKSVSSAPGRLILLSFDYIHVRALPWRATMYCGSPLPFMYRSFPLMLNKMRPTWLQSSIFSVALIYSIVCFRIFLSPTNLATFIFPMPTPFSIPSPAYCNSCIPVKIALWFSFFIHICMMDCLTFVAVQFTMPRPQLHDLCPCFLLGRILYILGPVLVPCLDVIGRNWRTVVVLFTVVTVCSAAPLP